METLSVKTRRPQSMAQKETVTSSEIDAKNEAPTKPVWKSSRIRRTPDKYRDFIIW